MTITDRQRREVAERLRDRKMTEGTSDPKRLRGIGRATVLESQLFWIQTCMLPAFGRAEVMGFEPMLDGLADLIDRPACTVESAERWETAGCGRGVDYELSCGHSVTLGECDELRYCPACGAEVVDE